MPAAKPILLRFLGCSLAIFLSGCGSSAPPPAAGGTALPATTADDPAVSPALPDAITQTTTDEVITSGEYYDFCKTAEAEAIEGKADSLGNRFDMDAIFNTSVKGLEMSSKDRADLTRGFQQGQPAKNLAVQIHNEIKAGGMWKCLRVHKQKGATLAWFRMKGPAGINYHHLLLTKNAQGEIKATDIYIMAMGEMLSNMLRRNFLPFVASQNRSVVERLTSSESDYVKNLNTIIAFQMATSQAKPKEAIELYRKLPASVQQDKTMLVLFLKATSSVEDWDAYETAINVMRERFPGDANADLMGIDGYIFKKQYDSALACVDKVDKAVGGDPYLDDLRASIWLLNGDRAKAKALAAKVTQLSPPSLDALKLLLSMSLEDKDDPETLKCLLALRNDLKLPINDLSADPDYAGFVQSAEYQEWLKSAKN